MRVVFLGKVGYFFLGEFFLFLGKEDIIYIKRKIFRVGGLLWVVGADAVRDWSP